MTALRIESFPCNHSINAVLRSLFDKQKLEANYYDRMYENWHSSTSMAPKQLKTGRKRAYTIIYHRIDLFLSRRNNASNNWLEIEKKRRNELCDNIYRSSLPYKADSVNIIFQHMLRLGSL